MLRFYDVWEFWAVLWCTMFARDLFGNNLITLTYTVTRIVYGMIGLDFTLLRLTPTVILFSASCHSPFTSLLLDFRDVTLPERNFRAHSKPLKNKMISLNCRTDT